MRRALALLVAAFAVSPAVARAEIVPPRLLPPPARLVYLTDLASPRPVLWSANADGSTPVRLGMGAGDVKLSPDGKTVAIATPISEDTGNALVVTPAGPPGASRTLLHAENFLDLLAWSPDSTKLAVLVDDQPDPPGGEPRVPDGKLVVVDVKTGAKTVVAHGGIGGASFSPSSRQLVFSRAPAGRVAICPNIYTAGADGSGVHALTHDGVSGAPLWGPRQIAFSRVKVCSPLPDTFVPAQLWLIHPDGRGARQLTHVRFSPRSTTLTATAWSRDGRRLLAELTELPLSKSDAWTVDVRSGRAHDLTGKVDDVRGFGLSHDGTSVLVQRGPGTGPSRGPIGTIPWHGGRLHVLVADGAVPSWNR
jgi:hypothetical protein